MPAPALTPIVALRRLQTSLQRGEARCRDPTSSQNPSCAGKLQTPGALVITIELQATSNAENRARHELCLRRERKASERTSGSFSANERESCPDQATLSPALLLLAKQHASFAARGSWREGGAKGAPRIRIAQEGQASAAWRLGVDLGNGWAQGGAEGAMEACCPCRSALPLKISG